MQQLPIVFENDPSGTLQPTLQRLQPGNDLDIPLNERVDILELKLNTLITLLALQGFELPEEIINS